MLLNQNDYPKALECIETAQDVLCHELRGVSCFRLVWNSVLCVAIKNCRLILAWSLSIKKFYCRHLSTQLQELYKVIGRMLNEEFVALIQKEFGRSCENECEACYQEVFFTQFFMHSTILCDFLGIVFLNCFFCGTRVRPSFLENFFVFVFLLNLFYLSL